MRLSEAADDAERVAEILGIKIAAELAGLDLLIRQALVADQLFLDPVL